MNEILRAPSVNQINLHPIVAAARDLSGLIAEQAEESEQSQRIPESTINQLHDAGFFRMATPKEYGGDEVDLLTAFEAYEILGAADASVAWVVLIISANPFFMGSALGDQAWRATYGQNPDFRSAGQVGPLGKAIKVDGGYRISGRWNYGSGAEYCESLITGCHVYDGDQPVLNEHGYPEWRIFLHKLSECTLIGDSWNATGLRASGSYDYTIEDLFVPADWSFVFGNVINELKNPIYNYIGAPFSQLAAAMLGMAGEAIKTVTDLAKTKRRGPLLMREDPALLVRLAEAEAMRASARAYMLDATRVLLGALSNDRASSTKERAHYRLAATNAMNSAVKAIDMMYKAAGGSAIRRGAPLERMFRDVHTAQTHIQFGDSVYPKASRVMLGIDPQDPMF